MKVEYLFSRRKRAMGSKLIAWASSKEKLDLDHIPSHIAVLIDETIVIESTFTTGVRMMPYSHWGRKNQELYRLPCAQDYRHSRSTLEKATEVWGRGYDWLGILYFGYAFIMNICFNKEMPETNKWQQEGKYFCTEYASILADEDFSMCTPAKVCDTWLKEME